MKYWIDSDVVGETRVSVDEAIEEFNDKVPNLKFVLDQAHHPTSIRFKLGYSNTCDGGGHNPDKY